MADCVISCIIYIVYVYVFVNVYDCMTIYGCISSIVYKETDWLFVFCFCTIGAWCMVDGISICIRLYMVDCVEGSKLVVCLLLAVQSVHGAWLIVYIYMYIWLYIV